MGEFSLGGELKCPLAPANPGGGRERGRPERSPASPEMVGRMVGGGEGVREERRGKRKAGRNLRSPAPASEEKGRRTGPRRRGAVPGAPHRHRGPSPPPAHP